MVATPAVELWPWWSGSRRAIAAHKLTALAGRTGQAACVIHPYNFFSAFAMHSNLLTEPRRSRFKVGLMPIRSVDPRRGTSARAWAPGESGMSILAEGSTLDRREKRFRAPNLLSKRGDFHDADTAVAAQPTDVLGLCSLEASITPGYDRAGLC
jgi:hypothetical protein